MSPPEIPNVSRHPSSRKRSANAVAAPRSLVAALLGYLQDESIGGEHARTNAPFEHGQQVVIANARAAQADGQRDGRGIPTGRLQEVECLGQDPGVEPIRQAVSLGDVQKAVGRDEIAPIIDRPDEQLELDDRGGVEVDDRLGVEHERVVVAATPAPSSARQSAVLNFMVTRPGLILVSVSTSSSHPIITPTPTVATTSPVATAQLRSGWYATGPAVNRALRTVGRTASPSSEACSDGLVRRFIPAVSASRVER